MAVLSFKIQADYEKVVRLREEIAKLEAQMRSFGRNTPQTEIKAVEARLSEARGEFTALATEAAKAGAAIDSDFKNKIRSASSVVNDLTAKIIEQKSVVKDVEQDVRRLGEAYQKALRSGSSNAPSIKADYDAAKKALQEEKAALFGLTQEKAKATLETKRLKDEYAAFKEEAGEAVKANEGFTVSLGKIAGLVGGVTVLKQLVAQVVRIRGEFQDMETAIETLVGKDMAGKLMPQIKEMAKVSPLTMTDIVGAEKTMLGFNIEAEKTIDYLKAISDISMGNSQKFNSLTLAFSQMSAAGRLLGQDLNQFINAGFNPLQTIAEKTGKSIAQLKEEMSKGAISAEMVQQAFLDATSAGGKFYNMSENASKTINGQISMMQDAMDAAFNEIGTKTEGVIIKSIQTATALIQNYEKIGKVLVGLVATYGVYRTAVLLSTAATSKHTIAEIALTNVRIAARKAQQLLNAAMMTNPYVALTTVVAGLAATMWALRDNTTAAEKAQKGYDAMKEQAAQKEKEHADAIQGLIDKVRDETQAETERVLALMALKNEYPNIFAQYDIESLKLADILQLQKQINEENAKRKKTANEGSLAQYDKDIAKAEEDIRNAPNMGAGSLAYLAEAQKRLEALKARRDSLLNDMKQTSIAEFTGSLASKSLEELQEYQKKLEAGTFELDGSIVDISTANTLKDSVNKAISDINEAKKKSYSEDYNKAKEDWEAAKKAFEEVKKDKEKYTTAEYNERKTAMETAEKDFKNLGGDTSGKTDKNATQAYNEQLAQQERVLDAQIKSDKERARTAEDMEMMVEQARISAMKDGEKKRRAQRELDNRKELQSLERQKQEYIEKTVEGEKAVFDAQEEQKAKNDNKYKKQTFDKEAAKKRVETTDPVVQQYTKVIKYTEQRQTQDATKEDMGAWRDSMNAYLKEYGDYEGKKLAITQEYEQKIADATNEWDKASLSQKMKEELAALDIEVNKTTNAIAQLFGDMRDKSLSELEDISAKGTEALDFLKGGQWDEAKGKTLGISKETFEIWSKSPEKLKAIADALEGVRNTSEELRNPIDKITKGLKDLFDSAGDKNKIDAAFDSIKSGVGELSDAIGFVSDSIASMGDALGNETMSKISEGINSALNVASETMAGADVGYKVGGPWGAALGAAVGLASSLVTELSKAKDAVHDAEIERLAKEVKTLEKSYNSLGKSIEKAYSVDASNLIAQQNTLLEQQKTSLELMMLEEQAKKNPDDSRLDELRARIEQIDETIQSNNESAVEAIAGQSVMSAIDSFANAYADAWSSGADAAEASTKAVKTMLRNSLLEFLKGQLSDEVEAFNKRIAEAMADGIIDPWEEQQLNTLKEKMDEEAQNLYNQTSKYWKDEQSEEQQEATSRGYETLSEETGSELAGRALAQYESNLRMEESMRAAKESIDAMATNQVQIRDIAEESRALIASSYAELKQISENTGAVIKPIKEMSSAISEIKKKVDTL